MRLRPLFSFWHPNFRTAVIELVLVGSAVSLLIYAQNELLSEFSLALGEPVSGVETGGDPKTWVTVMLEQYAALLSLGVPLFIFALFFFVRIWISVLGFIKAYLVGMMRIRSRDEVESALLVLLLGKDDSFHNKHSAAETLNRLGTDLTRTSELRPALADGWWYGMFMISNVVFFMVKDVRLGVAAVLACVASFVFHLPVNRRMGSVDANQLTHDDSVKSSFEDYMGAMSEIQVARLIPAVRTLFNKVQAKRRAVVMRYVKLSAFSISGHYFFYLLAFTSLVLVVFHMRRQGMHDRALALMPVIIWSLPGLFKCAQRLVQLVMVVKLAQNSMERLLEYDDPAVGITSESCKQPLPPDNSPLRLKDVDYTYHDSDGRPVSGVHGVVVDFMPGCWTGLAGSSGSGKSTLVNLILGRTTASKGVVTLGETPIGALDSRTAACLFSYMPQTPALLDTDIAGNLQLGLLQESGEPSRDIFSSIEDIALLEDLGVADICRSRALDAVCCPEKKPALARHIKVLRTHIRARIKELCGFDIIPYNENTFPASLWVLESLTQVKCDHRVIPPGLDGSKGCERLKTLLGTDLSSMLLAFGRILLSETKGLLSASGTSREYSQLAKVPLYEGIWNLRRRVMDLAHRAPANEEEKTSLLLVALTGAPREICEASKLALGSSGFNEREHVDALASWLEGHVEPIRHDSLVGHLTWRDNLVFGDLPADPRKRAMADAVILNVLKEEGHFDAVTRIGLGSRVGQRGRELSGGQRQLIVLARTLLRRTPIVVLDEPTSALDPKKREQVAGVLSRYKKGRILITVSHDPAFLKATDNVVALRAGQVKDVGPFTELEESSETFRRLLARM